MLVKYKSNEVREQLIELIKDSVDMVEVMLDCGVDVCMTPVANGEYKAVCPFHDDHSPSMSVNTELKLYNCFSCGAGGDVFKFIQNIKDINFNETLDYLQKYLDLTDVYLPKFFNEFSKFVVTSQAALYRTQENLANIELAPLPVILEMKDAMEAYFHNGTVVFETKIAALTEKYGCKARALKHHLTVGDDEMLLAGLNKFKAGFDVKLQTITVKLWSSKY